MDFWDRQQQARRQTRLLIPLFSLAVAATIVFNYLILAACIQPFLKLVPGTTHSPGFLPTIFLLLGELLVHPLGFLKWLWDWQLAGWIALGTLLSITLGCLYKLIRLSRGGPAVAELLGGRRVDPGTADPDEQRLRNVTEEMAIAAGLPVPEVHVLDRERGINAFAAGHTRNDVAIGVTYGCLKLLERDELQGVVAHELSHVLNGDTRLNMKLMALAHGLFWPTLAGRLLLRGSAGAPEIGESIFDEPDAPVCLPLLPLALLFKLIGSVSLPFTRLIKGAVCREREWLADAAAVQFTRNPPGLAGVFKKIGGLLKQGRLDTPFAEIASHLYFVNSSFDPWLPFLATHPPLLKRLLTLEPTFDGRFPHLHSLPSRDAEYDRIYEESVRRARAEAKAAEDKR